MIQSIIKKSRHNPTLLFPSTDVNVIFKVLHVGNHFKMLYNYGLII